MATKYEYFDDTSSVTGVSTDLRGQTFTPSTSHKITEAKFYVYASSAKPDHTASIRATSGGAPTGSDLVTATVDCSGLSGGAGSKVWLTATFATPYYLAAGTVYALCFYGESSLVYWCKDGTGGYAGGQDFQYYDSQWNAEGGDFLFEEWGNPYVSLVSDAVARVSSIRHIAQPGSFRMQVGLGDLGFDVDVAEATVRSALDTGKEVVEAPPEPSVTKPKVPAPAATAPTPPAVPAPEPGELTDYAKRIIETPAYKAAEARRRGIELGVEAVVTPYAIDVLRQKEQEAKTLMELQRIQKSAATPGITSYARQVLIKRAIQLKQQLESLYRSR